MNLTIVVYRKMLPNLVIIGASKSGTTSLHNYLNLHPQVQMSKEKELNFFIEERNWRKGVGWYESNFEGDAKIYGEASPLYTKYPRFQGIPNRMTRLIPEAKLIYILRDPIARIVSEYKHRFGVGFESRTFQEVVSGPNRSTQLLNRSKYYMQLEQFLSYFKRSSILIITLEGLKDQPMETLGNVFRFLEVDSNLNSAKFSIAHNSAKHHRRKTKAGMFLKQAAVMRKIRQLPPQKRLHLEHLIYYPFSRRVEEPQLNDSLRGELIDYVQDDVALLRKFTGHRFENWCV